MTERDRVGWKRARDGYKGKASAGVVSEENEIMNVRLATTAPQTPT